MLECLIAYCRAGLYIQYQLRIYNVSHAVGESWNHELVGLVFVRSYWGV